jgi:hypothetical protein
MNISKGLVAQVLITRMRTKVRFLKGKGLEDKGLIQIALMEDLYLLRCLKHGVSSLPIFRRVH